MSLPQILSLSYLKDRNPQKTGITFSQIHKRMKLLFILIGLLYARGALAQVLTEEQYRKSDNEMTEYFHLKMNTVQEQIENQPEKRDSLHKFLAELHKQYNRQNIDSAIKYSSLPSGVQRLFWLRKDIPKAKLNSLYNELPSHLKLSEYGKCLDLYLKTKQCKVGDSFYDFHTFTSEGDSFKLSAITSDYIMIVYDGLSCMGPDGVNYFKKLYSETDRNKITLIQYIICTNQTELKKIANKNHTGFTVVSDFLYNESPLKIIYETQATPTFIIIDKKRKVVYNSAEDNDMKKFSYIVNKCKVDKKD